MAKTKQARSCYKRHAKREYQYSKHLRDWQTAIRAGKPEEALNAAEAHAQQFGYKLGRKSYV
jgi:hypothetical protein